jgi:hypothetical protein
MASIDRTSFSLVPREAWVVNNDEFKPKTTRDMSPLAKVWFLLLSHYEFKFSEIFTTDEQK